MRRPNFNQSLLAIGLLLVVSTAVASNSGITYQGRILKPDGSPLAGATTQFKMQIRTPDSQDCLMYEEVQTQDLRNSGGIFSLTINDGTGARTDSTGLTLDRIFANRGTFTLGAATCATGSGNYTPNVSDGRSLVVLFKDETMATWEPIPPAKINFVPFAFESKQLQGFGADSLLRVVGAGGDPLTGLAPLSNAQYNELLALLNGTSTQFTKSGQLNGVALPTMNSGEVLGWNGSAWVSQTASGGPNSVTTAMIQNAAVDSSKIATGAVGSTQIANSAVGTSQIAGNVSINTTGTLGSAITTTRDFKIYAASPSTFYVGMLADPTLAASYTLTWPLTAGSANQVLTTDGSGKLTWTSPSSAGITDLTGDVTATGPGSAAATVASVGGSTAALVHSAELAANAATSANTPNTIVKRDGLGGFAAGAVTQGSSVYKDSGSNTVTVQAPTTVSSSYVLKWPTSAGGSGDVLTTDASGNLSWVTPSGVPTGSAGGDLTGSYPNPTVATVGTSTAANIHSAELLANAATAANTPNAIVKRDGSGNFAVGDITASNVKADALQLNNASSVVNVVNPMGAAYTLTLPANTGTTGQVLTTNGSGVTSWASPLTSATAFVQGGNTFGANADLGTNDSFDLNLRTAGATKVTVTSGGKVGIGTTAPTSQLEVVGANTPWGNIRANVNDNSDSALTAITIQRSRADATPPGAGFGADLMYNLEGYTDGSQTPAGSIKTQWENAQTDDTTSRNSKMTFSLLAGGSYAPKMTLTSTGSIGIGTTAPATKLEVVGSLRVGDGGETCDAGHTGAIRYNGGNLQFCAGSMPWTTLGTAGSGLTALTGDVTATGPGSATATVASVGGSSAANVHSAELLANAATDANTASTIVKRDSSGNFSAGAISAASVTAAGAVTQGSAVFKDSGSNTVTLQAPTSVVSSYVLKWPTSAGGSDEVLKTDASGNLSWTALPAALPPNGAAGGDLTGNYPNPTVATVGTSTAADVHSAELLANAATAANTPNAIVKRDGSGNFSAGDITASNVKTDTLQLNNAGSIVNIVNPMGAAYTLTLPTGTGTTGQVLTTNGLGVTSWTTPLTGTTGFVQGGNTFSTNADLGTNDAYDLNLRTGGTTKMTVTSGGSVGIGTTSPGYMLDVNGAINATALKINGVDIATGGGDFKKDGSVSMTGAFKASNGSNPAPSITFASDTDTGFYTAGANDGSFNMTLNGVDTASFDPYNGIEYYLPVSATNGSVSQPDFRLSGHSSSGTGLYSPATNAIGIATNSTEKIRITSAGDVGIGTTNPGYKLDVNGVINATGLKINGSDVVAGGGDFKSDGSVSMTGTFKAAAGSSSLPSITFDSDPDTGFYSYVGNTIGVATGGNVRFRFTNAGIVSETGGAFSITNGSSASSPTYTFVNNNDTGMFRATTDTLGFTTGGSEKMRITASGNVGIGTTSPASALEVVGTIKATGAAIVETSGSATLQTALTLRNPNNGTSSPGTTIDFNTSTSSIKQAQIAGGVTGGANKGFLSFITRGTSPSIDLYERMRIDDSGNVGIGTTSPGYKLDVAGDVNVTGGFKVNGVTIATGGGDFMKDGSVAMTGALKAADGNSTTPSITFGSDPTTGFYKVTTGNVGFIANGTEYIRINSAFMGYDNSGARVTSTVTNQALPSFTWAADTDTGIYRPTADTIGFSTSATEKMRITSAGNVGIGTTSPVANAKLDVNGQIKGGFLSHASLNTNWASGNIQQTSVAAGTLTFTSGSMYDGASYVLILTSAGTFTLSTAGDITAWKCLPACSSNQVVATGHTVLTIIKAGTTGYLSWGAGYQ